MLKFSFRNGICLIGIYGNDMKIISILQTPSFFPLLLLLLLVLNQLKENLKIISLFSFLTMLAFFHLVSNFRKIHHLFYNFLNCVLYFN